MKKIKLQDDEIDYTDKAVATLWDNNAEARARKGKTTLQPSRKRVGLVSNRQGASREKKSLNSRRRSSRLSEQDDRAMEVKAISQDPRPRPHSSIDSKEEEYHGTTETSPTSSEHPTEVTACGNTNADAGNASLSPFPSPQEHTPMTTDNNKEATVADRNTEPSPESQAAVEAPIELSIAVSPTVSSSSASVRCEIFDHRPSMVDIIDANTIPQMTEKALLSQFDDTNEDSDDTELAADADTETRFLPENTQLPATTANELSSSGTESSTEIDSFESVEIVEEPYVLRGIEQSPISRVISLPGATIENIARNPSTDEDFALPSTLTQSFIEQATEDDTEFLQGFLSRARAKKEAKAASQQSYESEGVSFPLQPRTRSRRRHSADEQTPVTARTQRILRPPVACKDGSQASENTQEEDLASPRRSSRARVPRPSTKVAPAVPSTIPVRRPKGTEFVFLQKDETQKLALTTRRNTQRNKGEAVHPTCRLLELNRSTEEAEGSERTRRSRSRSESPQKRIKRTDKQVQWDIQLAYFQERKKTNADITSSGTRRNRRIGTPAPKRVMEKAVLGEEMALESSALSLSGGRPRLRGD